MKLVASTRWCNESMQFQQTCGRMFCSALSPDSANGIWIIRSMCGEQNANWKGNDLLVWRKYLKMRFSNHQFRTSLRPRLLNECITKLLACLVCLNLHHPIQWMTPTKSQSQNKQFGTNREDLASCSYTQQPTHSTLLLGPQIHFSSKCGAGHLKGNSLTV